MRQISEVYFPLMGSIAGGFGAELRLNSTYHPQTDRHTETIQTFGGYLRACVLDEHRSWDCVALYGQKCQTRLCLYQVGESWNVGPSLVLIHTCLPPSAFCLFIHLCTSLCRFLFIHLKPFFGIPDCPCSFANSICIIYRKLPNVCTKLRKWTKYW